jgi:hypothetical protein
LAWSKFLNYFFVKIERKGKNYPDVGDVPEIADLGHEVDSGDPDLSKDENDEDLLMLSFGSGYHFSSGSKRSH